MSSSQPADKRKPKRAHGPTVNALKRAKYEAKQQRLRQASSHQDQPFGATWFADKEEYAVFLTLEDVRDIRKLKSGVDSADIGDDARRARIAKIAEWVEPFFDLKDSRKGDDGEKERLFISEGTEAVRMMVQRCEPSFTASTQAMKASIPASVNFPPPIRVVSILSKPATFFDPPTKLLGDVDLFIKRTSTAPPFKVIIASEEALSEIAGFAIARGAMACGVVPTYMKEHGYAWMKQLLVKETKTVPNTIEDGPKQKPIRRLLALDAISNAANMGSILRTAAAFSIDAIILSDDSCDAWYRQSVRVSLGHVASVPTLRVADWERGLQHDSVMDGIGDKEGLPRVLKWLRQQMKTECFAAVVDDEAGKGFPPLVALETDQSCGASSWCIVLGNEGSGICDEVIRECDKRIKIGMAGGVDSLSLPIAAGILMHSLSNRST